ncbi:MAG: hypothetical protein JWM91_4458 [Rhodospirillales bacterium]|nr:hypothetical protein [Rhodospirillales bacterium]
MTTDAPYAVIFKAFAIDDFVMRRLARVVAAAPSADVYLMVDETSGSLGPILFDRVIRYRESDVIGLGFAPHSEGSLFWYNADYPLYYFQYLHPDYDLIIMIEYDAVPNIELDAMVRECRDKGVDFVGQPITKPLDEYWWTSTMLHFYSLDQVRPYLICAAVFSARAVRYLAESRLRQGSRYELPDATGWPIGETFVGTELALSGLRIQDLSDFGGLTRYDWWPPTHESELRDFPDEAFVHPVLVGRRYLKSLFKNTFRSGLFIMAKLTTAMLIRTVRRGVMRGAAQSTRSAANRR